MSRVLPLPLLLALTASATPARAELPLPAFPECGEPGGACPSDFDRTGDWNLSSLLPADVPRSQVEADEVDLGSGIHADRAWQRTTGRTDVLIAVLDSGIKWDDPAVLNKHFIHVGELPDEAEPQDAGCVPREQRLDRFDCDGNGVVNIADWANDPRVDPALGDNAGGAADDRKDPSDLIALFSNGVDDDGNGYIDDISGWDFFWNDNNPYDDTRYGHGTGEAKDSAAEGGDGHGSIGVCPNCMVLNVRVSDSFVADGNNFAMGTLYAVDMGALVVQEALGALNNSDLVKDAIEYAWDRGVTVIASAADETAYHHNYPGNNHHTVYVHAVRYETPDRDRATTFLAYSNCTNFGPRLVLSASSTSCSSGATGVTAGVAGLMYSAAKDALASGAIDRPLSANEAHQLLALTADDIATNPLDDDPDLYPSHPGWDRYFGYGRVNTRRVVDAVLDGEIPPEADLLEPDWFELLSLAEGGSVDVVGLANAPRSASYRWDLQLAPGADPRDTEFVSVASGEGAGDKTEGVLHTLDLRSLPIDPTAVIDEYTPLDDPVSRFDKVMVHALTLRLQVRDAEGRLGEMRKAFFVQDDPDLMPGAPFDVGTGFEGSPKIADVDGDGRDDLVFGTSGGRLHVTDARAAHLPGWPVRLPLIEELDEANPANHRAQRAFASGEVVPDEGHTVTASPAIGDLDGDGRNEVVAATLNGVLAVFHADGTEAEGWPFRLDRGLVEGRTDPRNVYDYGFFGSPALGDLDGDGDLEIVIGAMDGRVYAFEHDGTIAAGWPVELRHEYGPEGDRRSNGERIISSPALGDADGDGFLEVAIGTNQKTTGTYGIAYLLAHDGSIQPGWPVELFGAYTNALPFVGEGVPGSPTFCDVDGDGRLEIGVHTIADSGSIFSADGSRWATLARLATDFGYFTNTDEQAASTIMINSGAWGDLDGDGVPDYAVGAAGFEYAQGLLDDGRRHDHDHLIGAWSGATIEHATGPRMPYIDGFPRQMEDLQFFLNPAIVDIDGDGRAEVVNGSAGHVLHAYDRDGHEPAGWPKQTGQWLLGSPAVGDVDGDGFLDVWVGTRSGSLFGWRTTAPAHSAQRSWVSFRNDPANTGHCAAPLRSYPEPPPEVEPEGCAGCAASVGSGGAGWALLLLPLALRRRRGDPSTGDPEPGAP